MDMPSAANAAPHPVRRHVVNSFAMVEDVVYVGLGVLLAAAAVFLLISGGVLFVQLLTGGELGNRIVDVLDRLLLILLIIELLYTVQVSFREHGLVAEPFLVVGLIAAVRRILVLTAQVPKLPEASEPVFRHALIELGLLTVMVLVLVASLTLLQKRKAAPAEA